MFSVADGNAKRANLSAKQDVLLSFRAEIRPSDGIVGLFILLVVDVFDVLLTRPKLGRPGACAAQQRVRACPGRVVIDDVEVLLWPDECASCDSHLLHRYFFLWTACDSVRRE